MTKFSLTYKQTPRERYRSEMNANVEDLIDAYQGVRLVSIAGGSMIMGAEHDDDLVADQTLIVDGTQKAVRGLVMSIERQIGREVQIELE